MEFTFNAYGDYKTEFTNYVDALFDKVEEMTRKQRIDAVQDLTDRYVDTTGEVPNGVQLDRLGTLILHEEISDRNPHKMSTNEYPIMSDRQARKREEEKELPFKYASTYGIDGKKHGRSTRNTKNNHLD